MRDVLVSITNQRHNVNLGECVAIWNPPCMIITREEYAEDIETLVHEFSEITISKVAELIKDDLCWVAHLMLEFQKEK